MKLLVRCSVKPRPVTSAWLRRLSSLVLKRVKGAAFAKNAELSIVLTGDAEVKKINRVYRKKNKTTDVLSFPLLVGKKFPRGHKGMLVVGDVVISVPQTKRQSAEAGKDFKSELGLLLIHGILHLLGHDHATLAQEKKMFGLQNRLLEKFEA